jgi:hypothetical protein
MENDPLAPACPPWEKGMACSVTCGIRETSASRSSWARITPLPLP